MEQRFGALIERLIELDLCEPSRAQLGIVAYSIGIRLSAAGAMAVLGLPGLAIVSLAGVPYYALLAMLRGRSERFMLFVFAYGVEWSLWALIHWFVAGPYCAFELYPLVLSPAFILLFRGLATPRRLILIANPPVLTAVTIFWATRVGAASSLDLDTQLWLSLANEVVVTVTVMVVAGVALLEQLRGRREAEQREATQAQLVEDMSHELRTPLATMLTLTQGALAPGGDERRKTQRLEWIEESVREAHRLVERLLDLAALDVERQDGLQAGPSAAVVEVVRGAVERARILAEAREITISLEIRHAIVREVDAASLEAVLRNLLANAISHSMDGSQIDVRVRDYGTAERIDVEDHGEGIAPEHLPRIFERMWRADPARTRAAGRYGLGLPIAQRHARLLGARLTVSSELGRGSTFSVLFPRP